MNSGKLPPVAAAIPAAGDSALLALNSSVHAAFPQSY
jgi:hypothetical protein